MADRVRPIKIETVALGGSQNNTRYTPANKNEDGLEMRAVYIQNDTSADSLVGITRDGSNNLQLFDSITGTKTLAQLAAAAITYGSPVALTIGGSNTDGVNTSLARSDHVHSLPAFGSTVGTICQGSDARLTNARTPTAHASSHEAGGGDQMESIGSLDTNASNIDPQARPGGLYADLKANATDGLVDGGTYHGVLTFRQIGSGADFSGGNVKQLAFTEGGNLWLRLSTGATSWGQWARIHSDSNFTSGVGATNWAPGNHTHAYLPSGGGTISGALQVNGNFTCNDFRIDYSTGKVGLNADPAAANYKLQVINNNNNSSVASFRNSASTGYSGIRIADNNDTSAFFLGWGNPTVAITQLRGVVYLQLSAGDFVITDGAGTTEWMRLGYTTGNLNAKGTISQNGTAVCLSNDAKLTNARTPTAHASSHQPGGGDAMAVDAAAGTGSLRTLGTGATNACAGNDARLNCAIPIAWIVGAATSQSLTQNTATKLTGYHPATAPHVAFKYDLTGYTQYRIHGKVSTAPNWSCVIKPYFNGTANAAWDNTTGITLINYNENTSSWINLPGGISTPTACQIEIYGYQTGTTASFTHADFLLELR